MRGNGGRPPADRIRNVALVGHRGAGKTSLHEALLFEAGAIGRLGSVPDGSTVSDSDPDEQSRQMSISASLSSFEWRERKINLLDTPGEPSFVADALGALRVWESAIFVVKDVMGVEVWTSRRGARGRAGHRADAVRQHVDRERADFSARSSRSSALGPHAVATEIPIAPSTTSRRDRSRRHEGVSPDSPDAVWSGLRSPTQTPSARRSTARS
jgi:elongation factor G